MPCKYSRLDKRICPEIVRAHEDRCERVAEEHRVALLIMSEDALRSEYQAAAECNEELERLSRDYANQGRRTESEADLVDVVRARLDRARTEFERRGVDSAEARGTQEDAA